MRRSGLICLIVFHFLWTGDLPAAADDVAQGTQKLEDVVVEEKAGADGIAQMPGGTVIDMTTFQTIGPQTSILDTLKTRAMVDFRGSSSLDPGIDSIFLRGFESQRFVTAVDALTVQKTGGRKSSNIVDFALLPTFLIKEVEILPGPHSALYDSKSIGGVINMVSEEPRRRDSLKPEATLTTSYGAYQTQDHLALLQGAVRNFTYDVAYRRYLTDGYLRHSETDINTAYGRIGYLLPADGFVTLSFSRSDTNRDDPVNNPGATFGDYDSDYPLTEATFDEFQDPTWDGESHAWRLNFAQPSPMGRITLGACSSKERRNRAYFANPGDGVRSELDTTWWQESVKLQDDIAWHPKHTTTVGIDQARLYDNGNTLDDTEKNERIRKTGGFVQHRWDILPTLDLTLGVRYESVEIHVSNLSGTGALWNPAYEAMESRDWDQFMPKSFLTYKMDELAAWLRDTAFSVGVSKIWRAPDYHGDYNPQGRPAGLFLEPEHGMGYDFILSRRLWRDIQFKIDYSFYDIEDFISGNSSYAQYSGAGAGALRFSDYKINLEEVYRHGIDVEVGGHLSDHLSFYLSYSWQDFQNQGDEPAGETELDQRAEHRVSAGLRYQPFEKTTLLLDYYFQDDEVTEISEEISPGVYYFRQVAIEAYHTVDIGIAQTLFERKGPFRKAMLNLYVKNLFDEEYFDTTGYPATDRFFGASLSLSF
jgi:outer membrane receptor protein involved in Fe transport